MLVKADLQKAMKEENIAEYSHILKDLNEKLKTVCACGMEIEMSDTGFYEMTFDTAGNKTAQLCAALLKKMRPKRSLRRIGSSTAIVSPSLTRRCIRFWIFRENLIPVRILKCTIRLRTHLELCL